MPPSDDGASCFWTVANVNSATLRDFAHAFDLGRPTGSPFGTLSVQALQQTIYYTSGGPTLDQISAAFNTTIQSCETFADIVVAAAQYDVVAT